MSLPSEELRKQQNPFQRHLGEFVYELTREPILGVVLLGIMEVVATEHPSWSYWKVLEESAKRIAH